MCEALACLWCAHGARTAKRRRTWACAEHWLSGGARTGRARQNGGAPGNGRGIGFLGAGPALRPKAGQSFRHLLRAKPFCRARLVRAPMAGKCLRAWQVLRKGARLRTWACAEHWLSGGARTGRARQNGGAPPCKFFRIANKNLATGAPKYDTIPVALRRIVPSNGEGMLCHARNEDILTEESGPQGPVS